MTTKQISIIVGAVIILAVLVAGAFFGAQMLSSPQGTAAEAGGGDPARVMEIVTDDGSGPRMARITIEPAPELPNRPSDTSGVFVRHEDNSYFVGTGDIELDIEVNGDTGERDISLGHSGPILEVVVTRDTLLYEEVTEGPTPDQIPDSGEMTIQQVLEPVDVLPEFGSNVEVQVWGEQRGDRVIAEVFVYRVIRDF